MNLKNIFGKRPPDLPTNLAGASREKIRENLPSWDARVRARRAKRLGVSVEEAANVEAKPFFMIEIENRAVAENRTVESLLEECSQRLRQSTYPTADCLLPDEVAEYAAGTLALERLEHAETCNACATLVAAAMPSEDAARDLVDALRAGSPLEEQVEETEQTPIAAPVGAWPAFDFAFARKWAPAVLVPVFALLAMYAISLNIDTGAARQTFLHSRLTWMSAFVAALLSLGVSGLKRSPVLRSIGVGVAFTAVLASSFFVDFRRTQSADRDLAIKSAMDQLSQFSVTSLENRRVTGKFIDVQHSAGPLRISTTEISDSQVRYVVTDKQLLGQAVADIGEYGGGEIKWQEGNKTIRKLELLTGKIRDDDGIFKIHVADGRTYTLPVTDLRNLVPNTQVFAVVDSNTASVNSMRIVDNVPQRTMIPASSTTKANE